MTRAHRIKIGSRTVLRIIPPGRPVRDGTLRCTFCGQIDEPGFHDAEQCPVTRRATSAASTALRPALRPLISALRTLGFTLDFDTKAGGGRTVQFKRAFGQRDVEVQLFDDGGHRATHMVFSDAARHRGLMDTLPTAFADGPSMLDAIMREVTRMDNSKLSGSEPTCRCGNPACAQVLQP